MECISNYQEKESNLLRKVLVRILSPTKVVFFLKFWRPAVSPKK